MLVHTRSIVATMFLQVDVLLHELTHCVHSEHDDNFDALNSLLKMECASTERTSPGRTVVPRGRTRKLVTVKHLRFTC